MNESDSTVGRVDTHLHLLFGMDDGPANLEASLAMAEVAIADGTTHVVVTAHANYQFVYAPELVRERCAILQQHLQDRLKIFPGCELHLSYENVQAALANPRLYSLNGSRYLLCEFPELFEASAMRSVLQQFVDIGLCPVLAHPERNPVFQRSPETLFDYLQLGCLSQLTASSFSGRFGKQAQQFAADLLQRNWIHLVASDGHSAEKRAPRLSRVHAHLEQERGGELAYALCTGNPMALLTDQDLVYTPELAAVRKRGLFARFRA